MTRTAPIQPSRRLEADVGGHLRNADLQVCTSADVPGRPDVDYGSRGCRFESCRAHFIAAGRHRFRRDADQSGMPLSLTCLAVAQPASMTTTRGSGSLRHRGGDQWEVGSSLGPDPVSGRSAVLSVTVRGDLAAAQRQRELLAAQAEAARRVSSRPSSWPSSTMATATAAGRRPSSATPCRSRPATAAVIESRVVGATSSVSLPRPPVRARALEMSAPAADRASSAKPVRAEVPDTLRSEPRAAAGVGSTAAKTAHRPTSVPHQSVDRDVRWYRSARRHRIG